MAGLLASLGICPQCKTPLRTEKDQDGSRHQRCPRCGWSDRDRTGPARPRVAFEPAAADDAVTPAGEPAVTPAPPAAGRQTKLIMNVALAILIALVALVAFVLSKANGG